MKYPYTQTDLLNDDPYHYMYTPFEGQPLIESYASERKNLLSKLQELVHESAESKEIANWQNSVDVAFSQDKSIWPFKEESVDTLETLKELVLAHVVGCKQINSGHVYFINELKRKFEISKRLRLGYDRGYKAIDKNAPVSLEAYAFLSFMLSVIPHQEGDLKLHNALLKLNDLIFSSEFKSMSLWAMAAFQRSVRYELELTRTLLFNCGIAYEDEAYNA
ncbi:MAG: hypothetical protein HON65_17090 [Rhodospirillales bacterium]|jgi:hypothetical protein|nr:hypothetical protein [Rhodospirillales bacterium]